MGTSKRLRSDDISGGGTPTPLVDGESFPHNPTRANMGTGDVRQTARRARTVILTELGAGVGDTFMVGAYSLGVDGDFVRTDTAALAYNATAATTVQTALRTATGDTTLTCADNAGGPYTVTYVLLEGLPELVVHTCTGAMAVQVTRSALTYDDVPKTGTAGTVPSTNGIMFDQESSKGIGATVPLGYSIDSRGTGQTRGTELLPPVVDGFAGGTGSVVVTSTADASDGSDGVALIVVRKLELASGSYQYAAHTEDADGDATITLAAGDYVGVIHAVTQAADATTGGQVSRGSAPTYFSVA